EPDQAAAGERQKRSELGHLSMILAVESLSMTIFFTGRNGPPPSFAEQVVQGVHESFDARVGKAVEYLLAFLAPGDQPGRAQFGELLRQARLADTQPILKSAHRTFALDQGAG